MSDFKPGFKVGLELDANEKQINNELDNVQNIVDKSIVELPVKISKKELISELENTIKDLDKKLESVSRRSRGPASDRKQEYIDLYDDIMKRSEELNITNKKIIKEFAGKYSEMINSYRKDLRAAHKADFIKDYTRAVRRRNTTRTSDKTKEISSKETKTKETSSEKKVQDAIAKAKIAEKQVENVREELQNTIQKTKRAVDTVNRFENGPPPDDEDRSKGVLHSYYTLLNGDESSTDIAGKIGAKFLLDQARKAFERDESDTDAKKSVETLQNTIENISAEIKHIEDVYNNRDELVVEAREKLNVAIDNLRKTHDESSAVFKEVYGDLSKLPSYTDEVLNRSDADWKAMQGKWIKFITTIQEVFETVDRTWEDLASDKLFFKQLRMGAGRGKVGTPGSDINLGTRTSNWDDTYYGVRDKKGGVPFLRLNASRGPYYGRSDVMQKNSPEIKKPLIRRINKEEAENAPRSKRTLTIYEIAAQKASIAISDMTNKLGKINKGLDDTTIEDALDSMKLAFDYLKNTSVNEQLSAIKSTVNRAFGAEFNTSGTFAITDGTPKGQGVNFKGKVEAQKEILADIGKMSVGNIDMFQVGANRAILNNVTGGAREAEKEVNKMLGKTTDKTSSGKKKEKIADNSMYGRDMKAYKDSIKATTSAINTQTQAMLTNSTIQEINDTKRNAILETDAGDGSNDQSNFNKLLDYQADLDNVAKRIHSNLGAITSGGIGGDGNIVPPGGNIPGGSGKGPVYMPVLMSIYERLVYIGNLLLNAPFLQGINIGDNYPITASDVFEKVQETEKETSDDIVEEIKESTKQIVTELAAEKTDISKTQDTAREIKPKSFIDTLKNIFNLGRYDATAKQIMSAKEERIAAIQAERQSKFGLVETGRDSTMTGDKVRADRFKRLYRGAFGRYIESPFEGLQLTKGMTIDSEEITKALQKSIQKNMFEAQTGGILRNFVGSMTGYIGMPSLEKSRAQAEGLNEVMAIIRDVGLSITQAIEADETTLSGMVKSGQAVFGADGKLSKEQSTDYNTALALVASIEARKKALEGVLVDAKYTDDLITKMGGNISEIVKRLGFVAPELRDANKIIANISSGLDKSGKALKFQSRTAEILNYTFQLMTRSIGQMWKNWMVQLNPITQIKKAFSEFMSYDVKLQRTMNVVKYNIRTILRPFMEWIAQKFINIIGFVDIISMKIQEAFGKIPISLFDQVAADSEKIREELEAASNVSAGFDELHDIGSDNTGANDLLGDIYYPKLSEKWQQLATDIGDLFKGIITGDLGFGEVMAYILKILKTGLSLAFDYIGAFLTGVIWPFIKSHWGDLLLSLLGIFVGSKLISSLGSILWNALFSKLTLTSMKNFLGNTISPIGEFLGQTLYTGMNGAAISIGEVASGLLGVITGTSVAIVKAKELGDNWQDLTVTQKSLGVGLVGLSSALAGFSALVMGATGPIALAVAGGAALTSLLVGLTRTQDGISSVKKETKELVEAQEQAKLANDEYLRSMDRLASTMDNLEKVEKLTGLSGKDLDEQMKSGKLTIDEMTSSQMMVYNAYKQNEQAIKDNKDATEAKIKSDKAEVLQNLELQAANAIKAQSYDELKESVVAAWKEEAISAEEAGNILSRALANADNETQRVFGESIPSEIKSCYDPDEYENALRKFTTAFTDVFSNIWKSAVETGERIKNFFGGLGFKTNLEVSGDGSISANTIKTASYAVGTNYVPSDGLAYLHQGEAVIPKKYNQPYQPNSMSAEEASYMAQMMSTMRSLDNTMKQGINVNGQFVQRGSDLVAVVNKTKSQTGADLLSNVAYAR